MNGIVRPKTILLDTGHLVNLVHRRTGQGMRSTIPADWGTAYDELDGCLRSGELIPVFYEPLACEWIDGNSMTRALEIASVFDTALCVRCILPDPVLFLVEAMNAAKSAEPRLNYPGFTVLCDLGGGRDVAAWFRDAWDDPAEHPQPIPVVVPLHARGPSVSGIVQAMRPTIDRGRSLWAAALEGERTRLEQTRATQGAFGCKGPCPEDYKRHWLMTAHRLDDVLRRTNPALDPGAIISRIDLKLCPATTFTVDAYWQYARANEAPQENDCVDLMLLGPMAYVDVVLTERRLAGFTRQARHGWVSRRVFRKPADALGAIRMPESG